MDTVLGPRPIRHDGYFTIYSHERIYLFYATKIPEAVAFLVKYNKKVYLKGCLMSGHQVEILPESYGYGQSRRNRKQKAQYTYEVLMLAHKKLQKLEQEYHAKYGTPLCRT